MPNIIEVYVVHTTTDEWGRLGELIGIFDNAIDAMAAAKGKGWYGGEASIKEKFAIEAEGECYLLSRREPIDLGLKKKMADESLRAKTLASLTPEQRRVLGV